jgi:predicted nucleic acid-binding protein
VFTFFAVSPVSKKKIACPRRRALCLPPTMPEIVIRDPDDLAVVAAAIESKAEYLVSGDKDIISLVPLNEIKVVTPREFWEVISKIRPL